jgi:hypothetical protein
MADGGSDDFYCSYWMWCYVNKIRNNLKDKWIKG